MKGAVSINRTFAALRHPNYRLWFMGQLVSLVGTWMQSTAQGYLVYTLTQSPAFLGYVSFAAGMPTWVFTLWGGLVADRIPRRKLLIITQGFMMTLAFILAMLNFTGLIRAWHIIVLAFFLGIANSFDMPARQAFVSELVDHEDLTNAIAMNSTMFNLATVVGPAVAGITYAALGPAWCFTLNGVSFIAVIIALSLMKLPDIPRLERNASAIEQIKDGFRFINQNSEVKMLIIGIGVLSVFGYGVVTLMPAWAVNILHGDVTVNGYLLSARGLGSLIGALTIASLGYLMIRGKLWTTGSLLLPVALFAFSFTRLLPVSLLLLVALGWSIMIMANSSNSMVQTQTPDTMRGRVMSVYSMVFQGGMPIGGLIAGQLAAGVSEPFTVAAASVVLMVFAVLVFVFRPALRRMG